MMEILRANKYFLLGLGAQKAGTTWLHDHFRRHPNADFGFAKEYHVFDALYVNDAQIRAQFLQRRIQAISEKSACDNVSSQEKQLLRFLGDTRHYFDYFAHLTRPGSGKCLTGDITPSYAALPAAVLVDIRSQLLQKGFSVRTLFLVRDPIDRCLSAVRFGLRRAGIQGADEAAILRSAYASEGFELRTQYNRTIEVMEQVFPTEERLLMFYEELFTEDSIRKITDFIGISWRPPDFNRKLNVSRTEQTIDDNLKREIFRHYKSVYAYMAAREGKDRLSRLWPNYQRFASELTA